MQMLNYTEDFYKEKVLYKFHLHFFQICNITHCVIGWILDRLQLGEDCINSSSYSGLLTPDSCEYKKVWFVYFIIC